MLIVVLLVLLFHVPSLSAQNDSISATKIMVEPLKIDSIRKGNSALRINVLSQVLSALSSGELSAGIGAKYWLEERTALAGSVDVNLYFNGGRSDKLTQNTPQSSPFLVNTIKNTSKQLANINLTGTLEKHLSDSRFLSPYWGLTGSVDIGWSGNSQLDSNYDSSRDTAMIPIRFSSSSRTNRFGNGSLDVSAGAIAGIEYFPLSWLSISAQTGITARIGFSIGSQATTDIQYSGLVGSIPIVYRNPNYQYSREDGLAWRAGVDVLLRIAVLIYIGRDATTEFLKNFQ